MAKLTAVANRRYIPDGPVHEVQADEHKMDAGGGHTAPAAPAAAKAIAPATLVTVGLLILAPVTTRVLATHIALTPDGFTLRSLDAPPARPGSSGWQEEVTTRLRLQGLFGSPHIAPECRVLDEEPVPFLADRRAA